MAAIAKSGTPVPCSDIPQSNKLTLEAAAAIEAGDAVYINSAGKFALASGAATDALAYVFGFATTAASAGRPVTAAWGVRFHYTSGATPGAPVYLSPSVAGGLDTANATVTRPVGRFVDGSRIQFFDPADRAVL